MQYGVSDPLRTGTSLLSSGRRLGWAEWGPAQGKAVLFFSGAGMGRELGFGRDLLDELQVRLIAVERPGLGASDPAPGRTLSSWADDITELAAANGLTSPAILGFSQGGPFALACAAQGLCSGVALVSGQDDFQHPETRRLADAHLLGLLEALAVDASEVEGQFAATSAETLWRFVFEGSAAVDLSVYGSAGFSPIYRRALEAGFRQGGAGYARDFVLSMSPWPFELTAIECPVHLWYGELDQSKVHSPDFGAILATRLPNARRHLEKDAGSSLLWTHTQAILEALLTESGPVQ